MQVHCSPAHKTKHNTLKAARRDRHITLPHHLIALSNKNDDRLTGTRKPVGPCAKEMGFKVWEKQRHQLHLLHPI
jgi:hypothetical protein